MLALVKCGLQDRFPEEYKTWIQSKAESQRNMEAEVKKREETVKADLAAESTQLEESLREAIVDAIITTFPCVVCGVDYC
jgi:cytochrome c biogenesis protein ResB